jgi:hypothetical protein
MAQDTKGNIAPLIIFIPLAFLLTGTNPKISSSCGWTAENGFETGEQTCTAVFVIPPPLFLIQEIMLQYKRQAKSINCPPE